MAANTPNILFVMADQVGAPALPIYGHPVMKTPNLERLAAGGTVFENAYCNSPLCSTSRVSMLSGRLASELDAYDNASEFPAAVPTFAHYLRSLGYRTCLSGKMHLVGPDQLHGFEERLTTDFYPVDFGWTPNWEKQWEKLSFFHNMDSVTKAGVCARSMPIDYDDETTYQAQRRLYDYARDRADARPFFMTVSLTHPHDPYATTREYWDRYDDSEIDMPSVPHIPPERRDPHSRRLFYHYGMHEQEVTDADIVKARHAYYGMTTYVDDKLGQLMDTLERSGMADDTIVIFSADHGDMLGERGMWYKMSFYEWSASVPFVVRHPDVDGGKRVESAMSLIDLFPTLVEFAGGGKPDPECAPHLKGQSVAPLLQGDSTGWPDTVYSEYLGEGAAGPCLMVRKGRHKYVYSAGEPDSAGDPPQLFDLKDDPKELDDRAGRDDYATIEAELKDLVADRWDLANLRADVVESQKRRRFVFDALSRGKPAPWDYAPSYDAANLYIRNDEALSAREYRARLDEPTGS
ncbi:choline-sulfatase [Rhodovibrio sodomensis]|uniref:Choline-sulfatase n=1 Tax=Rhodovibrio sodomensis TaxID=1088 RepID=A0ABS1DKB3_9PROT|nr:choline-sulfatase [Rhodovibrio sodomensis]MBK1670951.1 choline-sulfatase [Rhodovibrio sodomensis]